MKLPFRNAIVVFISWFVVGCHAAGDGTPETAASTELALNGTLDHLWTPSDDRLKAPVWLGDDDRGALISTMYRGASDGIEDYIFAPADGDCENARGVFRIDWDSKKNTVHYQLKYKKIPPH